MSIIGINDPLYNSAAEYGPHEFWGIAGDELQLCASGQRSWVRAKGRWFFWQLEPSVESKGGLKNDFWVFVGEVRVCYGRQPMRPYEERQ